MRIRSIFISILMAVGFVLSMSPSASAATPTPTTPPNARTIDSCSTVAGKATVAADMFRGWNGTRVSVARTGKVKSITTVWRRPGGAIVRLIPGDTGGYYLFSGVKPTKNDTLMVTIKWTYNIVFTKSCTVYMGFPTDPALIA